jgi:bifunctional oligoribonuclease and PAP phosphatase NrnA
MKEQIDILKQWLIVPKQVVILSHRNPDGDALGSSLGLAGFLESFGHSVKVIFPSEYPSNLEFLQGAQRSLIFDLTQSDARKAVDEAEIIFCLDFNGLDRIDKLGENVQFSQAKKVMIDHHLDPEPFTDIEFSETEASSTAELVFKVIDAMGERSRITPAIGQCLMTGIITDTGSFKYGTRAYTYEVAGILKGIGVDDYDLADKLYNTQVEKNLRLLGHCLANRMEINSEYGYGVITLSKKDYADYEIQRGDTEGIVNFLLTLKKVRVAVFITEQPSIIKISLRSKGDISVQEIASKHFNGGGHKNASGGGVYASLADIKERVHSVLPQYLSKL